VLKNARALGLALQQSDLKLLTGGTDNHLVIADTAARGVDGARGETLLERIGIIANRELWPYQEGPIERAMRFGTPALTTRGMREPEMELIGSLIGALIQRPPTRGWRTRPSRRARALRALPDPGLRTPRGWSRRRRCATIHQPYVPVERLRRKANAMRIPIAVCSIRARLRRRRDGSIATRRDQEDHR
jgi:hypothetical protein